MSSTTIGNALKENRIKKALSLDEVHAKTKIHPRVLQLLEEGKFDKLPSPIFAKSFLRSYADFLGVNPNEVLDAYEREGDTKSDPEQVLFIKSVDEKQADSFAHKNIVVIASLIAAFVAGALLLSVVVPRVSGLAHKSKWPDPKSWFAHKPDPRDQAKMGNKDVAANLKKETQEIRKKEAKKSDEWVRSLDQGNFPKISKKAPLELRLRALDNVWVRVTADGKVLYQGIMGRNAVQTWVSRGDAVELWTGNASNMFLSVNRFSLGSPGHGMVRKIIISREGVRIPTAENH